MTAHFGESRLLGSVVMLCLLGVQARAGSWLDDFQLDPFKVWTVDTGPGEGFGDNSMDQFVYDEQADELVVEYDSSLPTVRLERPLSRAFTNFEAFAFSATLRFDSIDAQPEEFMQICFALTNSETTGANRTGSPISNYVGNTFDNVELAYYPNVSEIFGGPYVVLTVLGSDQGTGNAFDYLTFASTEDTLPLYTSLTFNGYYNPLDGLTFHVNDFITITAMPADPFTVDRFAVTTYFDGADGTPETVSLRATVSYDSTQFLALGDGDDDGDVDLPDFGAFQRCFTGGGVALDVGCETYDFDGDADVDLGDFAAFQSVVSGPLSAPTDPDSAG